MKVMMVAPYFYPKIGGLENYVYNISKGLKKDYGWEVVVVTSNHEGREYKEEVIDGIKVYRLAPMFVLSNTPINPFWYFQIKQIIKKEKPEIINAHSPVPFISDVSRLVSKNITFVLTYHSGSMVKNKTLIDIVIKVYEKVFLNLLFHSSTKIISYSGDFIQNELYIFRSKVVNISPGVNLDVFTPRSNYERLDNVIFVARVERNSAWKGLQYLIEAIIHIRNKIPNIKLSIIGDGDAIPDYKNFVIKKGLDRNVSFLGVRTGKALVNQLHKSDILVLPSTTDAESFGIVLIEAMATGTPVIGSRVGGIPYVIEEEKDGLLIEPENSLQLAEKIISLLKNDNRRKKMGKYGNKKVKENYLWKTQIEKYNNLLYGLKS